MNSKSFKARASAFLLAILLTTSQIIAARPLLEVPPIFPKKQTDGTPVKKLPPVNYIRSRMVDIKHVAIDLRFDWNKEQAFGSTIVTLTPFVDTNKISLDAAAMTIKSVTLNNGTVLKYVYDGAKDGDNLEVTLDRMYKRGEDVAVKVDYRTNYVNKADADTAIGSFGRGIRFIKPTADEPNKPRQIWSQGETEFNRYWFPSYDTPNDFRTSELRATVEKPYTVVSNGTLVDTKDNGDNTRTFYWKMDTPYANYLTSIVVGEYTQIKNGEYEGVPIYAFGYPSEAKEVAVTTKNLPATIKFFSEKTGVKYAYPKYSQTFVEDFGGGMENISATTQIEEMIHDDRELLDTDSESLQSHELAHQWFGDYVTCRDWGQIWLNESFATYFQALWDEELKGKDYFLYSDVRTNQQTTLNTWNQGNRRPIVTKYYANKDAMFDNYAYPGGGSVLHMLRKQLGDELFFKSLNRYLTENAHQPVSTEELRIAIEEATGQSMDWFFDEWLYKMGHPIFEVTKNYDAANKKLTLNVKQTQKVDPNNEFPQTEFFQTWVEVEIGTTAGTRVERVWLKPQAENVYTFAADANPALVNFDYEGALLKEMKFDKSVDELIYQFQMDRDVLGRRWAFDELQKEYHGSASATDKAKISAALTAAITKEPFWELRRDVITGFPTGANLIDPTAPAPKLSTELIAALSSAARDQKSNVRAAAITMLSLTRDAQFANLYSAALNDQSYSVIENAAEALATTKDARAFDQFVKLVNTPSWRDHLKIAGLKGLATLGDKRALDSGLKLAADATQSANVRSTALGIVAASGKGDPRAFPLIFNSFKTALANNDYQSVFNNLSSLVELADPRGQEAFDLAKVKYKSSEQLISYVTIFETRFKTVVRK